MDRHFGDLGQHSSTTTDDSDGAILAARDFGDDWVHEIIAMTRPGVEISFPVRAINEREVPFVYDDFS